MKMKSTVAFEKDTVLTEIQCFENGCFSLVLQRKDGHAEMRVYDALGHKVREFEIENKPEQHIVSMALKDGYGVFLRQNLASDGSVVSAQGVLFDDNGVLLAEKITDVQLFGNGWYVLSFGQQKLLYDDKHCLVAKNFTAAKVFSLGYALHDNNLFDDKDWILYLSDGTSLRWIAFVKAFLGDGNVLIPYEKDPFAFSSAFYFDGKELTDREIVDYANFENGRFVLYFNGGGCRMYHPDGTPLSDLVYDAEFFPDGRFVTRAETNIEIYRPNGLPSRQSYYSYERAGTCYAVSNETEQGVLYDQNGEKIGSGYTKVDGCGAFSLWLLNSETMELFCADKKLLSWKAY